MGCQFIENIGGRGMTLDSNYIRTFDRVFKATTTDPGYGPIYVKDQIMSQLAISPGITSIYSQAGAFPESDAGAQVIGIAITEDPEDGKAWTVKVSYGPWNPDTMFEDSPLNLPPELNADGQNYQKIIEEDVNGNPILNSAGDPFGTGAEGDSYRAQIRISQNVATWPAEAFGYVGYKNSEPFAGFPTGTLKQAAPQVERRFHPACGRYYVLHCLFDYQAEGWDLELLNEGFKELDQNGKQVPIYVGSMPTANPIPLDANGKAIAVPANKSDLVNLTFVVSNEVDFNTVYNFGTLP